MANLAHALHSFQSGDLSHNEFFAQVDHALASDQANSARLSALLSDERTRTMLAPDVYAELQRRVEYSLGASQRRRIDETRMRPHLGERPISPTSPSSPSSPSASWPLEYSEMAPERMKAVGDTLNGRFVLEECIGFGGMGTVYKALDLRKLEAADRKPYIAIKVLNVQFRGHPKSLITLQREARKAQQLAHPNIVTVYDFDRDGSTVYLTMEYLSGKSLSQVLRAPGFDGMPYAEALRIINGMGRALAYAHERGFVHCDFKPANVILTDSGVVKVIDFGIARVFRKPEEDTEATVFDPGSLGGLTPAYASPEMLEHREPDPRDDIYALACITYEMLTGRHPFDRFPATHARGEGMKPQRPKNLGHRQWRALKCALCFDREHRTPTINRFLEEMGEQRRPTATMALGASGLLAAVLVAIGFNYFREPLRDQAPATSGESVQQGQSASGGPLPEPAREREGEREPEREHEQPAAPPVLSLASVAPVLARVPCSALAPTVRGDALQVHGYVPNTYGAARLKSELGAIPGVKSVELDVQQVSDEKCGVIRTFAPYWTRNRQSGAAASIRAKAPKAELTEGDPLVVSITTPAYDSYIYVDYYVLDGNVVHMVPSPRAKAHQAPPNHAATIGSLGNWVISQPCGAELIVLVAAPAPLFDGLRPESESRAGYLQTVEKQLELLGRKYGQDRIAVDFLQITTKARKR